MVGVQEAAAMSSHDTGWGHFLIAHWMTWEDLLLGKKTSPAHFKSSLGILAS